VIVLGGLLLLVVLLGWIGREQFLGLAERALRRSSVARQAFPDARALYSYEWANVVRLAVLLVASGGVLLALARRARLAGPLALGLVAADLFSFGIGFNTAADPAPLRFVPPELEVLRADTSLFRTVTLGEDDTLPSNTNMLFGLQDARGYDTIILRDYAGYLELIEPQTQLLYSKVSKLFRPRSLDSPLLDLLNVKYVVTSLRFDSPGWRLVQDGSVRIYQNQRVLPRAFVVPEAVVASSPQDANRLLTEPRFDPQRTVVLEGEAAGDASSRTAAGDAAASVSVVSYGLNRVMLDVTGAGGYLVLSDVYFPGWVARIDGQDRPLLRADRAFRAVALPAGAHQVSFEYRPFSFRLGGLLSLLALGLSGLALAGWGYWRSGLSRRAASGPVGRVAKNSLFPLVTGLANRGLDFGFALVYLRLLGPQGAGQYAFAVVIVGYFDILANFGLGTLLTREVAREPNRWGQYFWNTLVSRLGLSFLALLVALLLAGPLAAPLQIGPEVGLALILLTLGLLPGAIASTSSALFQARERMEVPAAVTVLSTVSRIVLGTGVLLAGWGLVGLALVSLAVNLLNAAVLGGLLLGLIGRPRLSFDLGFSRGLLASAWPLMINNFLNSLFFRIDAVLLKPLAGEVALGHYSTAYKFIDGLQIIPSTFVLALFPLLSRQAHEDRRELAVAFGHGLKVLLMIALPITIGTVLLAEPIIELFAGPAYLPDAALALQVLIWFLPFSFVNGLTQYVLIALNRQRWITLSFFIGAVANALLNLYFISRFGFLGAAAITVVSEWILFVPFWIVIRRDLPPIPLLDLTWRPLAAALIMGLAVYVLRAVNPWLAIPVGAAVYLAVLFAIGGVSRAELRMVLRRG
jgi:O-antigen/teichoic acid export membrane protein